MNPARVLLLPVGPAFAVHAFLAARGSAPLRDAAEERHAAELLERCITTAEALVTFALYLTGRPSVH